MLKTACRLILDIDPEAHLRVFTTDPVRLKQLCPAVEAIAPTGQAAWLAAKCFPLPQRILPNPVQKALYAKEKHYKFENPNRALAMMQCRTDYQRHHADKVAGWLDAIDWADAVIVTGGGFVTDAFGGHLEGVLHTLRWARQKQRPTAFFGQGLGPLASRRLRRMASSELNAASSVNLREGAHGLALGASLGCNTSNWTVTGDDAFAILASEQHDVSQGHALGINVRVAAYAGVDPSKSATLATDLEAARSQCAGQWMPLPVDLCSRQGDAAQTLPLLAAGTISIDYQAPNLPDDLAALVAHCRIVITGSYHVAVFALAQGVPVVALAANAYYDAKFAGLAAFFSGGIRTVNHTDPGFSENLLEGVRTQWTMPDKQRRALVERSQCIANFVKTAYCDFFTGL